MTTAPTAILAEDEGAQRQELRAALAQLWPELEIVAECEDGLAAMEAVQKFRPTVAFLDISMPGVSGLEVARMASAHSHVVMITAFGQFALDAFDNGAADYLLKPVKRERLATAIDRLKKRIDDGKHADLAGMLEALRTRLPEPETRRISWISASVGDTIRMISIDDVLCFKSEDKYTCVVLAGGSAHIRTPLKELAEDLEEAGFWQIHRGFVVAVKRIAAVSRDEDGAMWLSLRDHTTRLPVSQRFQHRFKGM